MEMARRAAGDAARDSTRIDQPLRSGDDGVDRGLGARHAAGAARNQLLPGPNAVLLIRIVAGGKGRGFDQEDPLSPLQHVLCQSKVGEVAPADRNFSDDYRVRLVDEAAALL